MPGVPHFVPSVTPLAQTNPARISPSSQATGVRSGDDANPGCGLQILKSGIASQYSTRELGTKTASGRALDDDELTAAHKTLPFGSRVRVTNRANGRSVVVTITDRGPYVHGRVIDVSAAGARALGFSGLTRVSVEKVGTGS